VELLETDNELVRLEESGLFPGVLFRGLEIVLALALAAPKAEGDGGSKSAIPNWCSEVKWET
jgi:hypothetical protein